MKYVLIYIIEYVLFYTERLEEAVNSPVLRRNNGYQAMRHLSVHLYHLIINVDSASCHWNGKTTPEQIHPLIFSLQSHITDISHGKPILEIIVADKFLSCAKNNNV